jgi:hypothetical protein
MVSRGDVESLRALVQNLNVTALVLATILPFGAAVSAVCTVLALKRFVKVVNGKISVDNDSVYKTSDVGMFTYIFITISTVILCTVAMPLRQFLAITGIVVGLGLIWRVFRIVECRLKKNMVGENPKSLVVTVIVSLLALVFAPIFYMIGWSGMWLPKERITVSSTEVSPVYILSTDARWTSYMDDGRKVHFVPTPDVTAREAVRSSGSWLDKSFADNAGEWFDSVFHRAAEQVESAAMTG